MIELYRPVDCPFCIDVEAALQEMVLAHRVITVEDGQISKILPPNTQLPALNDNGQIITGQIAIKAHLKELEKFVEDWRRFQGDSCYIWDDDQNC